MNPVSGNVETDVSDVNFEGGQRSDRRLRGFLGRWGVLVPQVGSQGPGT